MKTIVYLPQYIGYRYQMNAGSLTHTMGVTSVETMISTLNDRFHWVEMSARTGMDCSNVAWLGLIAAVKLLANPGLPPEPAPDAVQVLMKLNNDDQSRLIDESLCTTNVSYAACRESGAVHPPVLSILQPETHLLYRDRRMFSEKLAPDQIKPVRILTTEEKKKFFLTLTEGGTL